MQQDLQFQFHFIIFGDAQGTFLDHESHDLVKNVGCSHGGEFGIGIVCRSHLHNISGYEVDTFEAADNSAELTGRPASSLGCTSSRSD